VISWRIMSKKKKWKKSEKPRFYGQNKLFFENPALQSLGSFNHMAACRSSLENIWKMSLNLFSTKKFHGLIRSRNWACLVFTKSLWNMQFTSPKEKIEKYYFSSHKLPKQQSTNFWSQGFLGVKYWVLTFLLCYIIWNSHVKWYVPLLATSLWITILDSHKV
jgi:hypothetical protein